MSNKKFTPQHEWLQLMGSQGKVGITDYAQSQLGDVVYVELPAVGRQVKQGEAIAVVESVKAASDVYAPVSGEIMAVNEALGTQPQLVNEMPEDQGWFVMIRLTHPEEIDQLMDQDRYQQLVMS